MPLYTYRREDGSTFDYRQKFVDEPLTMDPVTGQRVVRVVQAAGIIFKGSGFYVNDSKSASRNNATSPAKTKESSDTTAKSDASAAAPATTPATETKAESKPEKSTAAAD
jgi:predicted nucleic acid-binding Zn ribbon protein